MFFERGNLVSRQFIVEVTTECFFSLTTVHGKKSSDWLRIGKTASKTAERNSAADGGFG